MTQIGNDLIHMEKFSSLLKRMLGDTMREEEMTLGGSGVL